MSGVGPGAPGNAGVAARTITGLVTAARPRTGAPVGDPTAIPSIEAYANQLRASLARLRDVDDLVDEVVDHLLESASRLQRDGMDAAAAERESLARFGDQELVARAFRTTRTGGTVMPTLFTRAAGVAGLVAAAMMAAFLAMHALSVANVYDTPASSGGFSDQEWFAVAVAVFVPAVALLLGLAVRTGVAHGRWLPVVLAPAALSVPLFVLAWWAWPYWGSLLSIAALAVALEAHRPALAREGGSTWPIWSIALAWPLGAAVLLAMAPLALGPVDVHGDHVLDALLSAAVTAALFVPAAGRLGWWMSHEATTSRQQHPTPFAPA